MRFLQEASTIAMDTFLLVLGPCLICVVVGIIAVELYWFFTFLLPVHAVWLSPSWIIQSIFAIFLAVSVAFNYALCVLTNPGTHDSPVYKRLVDDAHSAGLLGDRETPVRPRSWIDQGDFEWGYCRRTKSRKAPRAHYDHVTRKLVLNMDHYCPWMFNVVGYMNYRYFVTFLFYVLVACVYGMFLTASPFVEYARADKEQGRPFELGDRDLNSERYIPKH